MIDDKTILAIIPARGGSKSLPGKNLRQVGGRPLIEWAIRAAKQSAHVDHVVLSSDDDKILEVAHGLGCDDSLRRPPALSDDWAGLEDVVIHALDNVHGEYDYFVLLQPTCPLRTARDIDGCIEACRNRAATSCISIAESFQSPFKMFFVNDGGRLTPAIVNNNATRRRQDFPTAYAETGAVYVCKTDWFRNDRRFITDETIGWVQDRKRSFDVDEQWQLDVVDNILAGLMTSEEQP